jgi:hypothetical protein
VGGSWVSSDPVRRGAVPSRAVRYVELATDAREVVEIVCDRCAQATSSAAFLLDLIV